jgi:alpha-beta hydrolase superfamily lysophospholipase
MQHEEETFLGFEGQELFYQSWKPEAAPKAAIAIVHGGAEHSGHYTFLVNHFLERGFALAGFDLRGHGRSKGRRGHVMDWDENRGDMDCYLSRVQDEFPGVPVFLFGHSMGGTTILDHSLRRSPALSGVILSGAGIRAPEASPILLTIAKIFSVLWPTLSFSNRLDFSTVNRDPSVVERYVNDPLVISTVTARYGIEWVKTIHWVRSHIADWKLPLLMLYGSEEGFCSIEDMKGFFADVGCEDKKLIIYEGGYHQPHSDLQKKQVFSDIEKWIDERSSEVTQQSP